MKENTIKIIGKTYIISMALTMTIVYFYALFSGDRIIIDINAFGEKLVELPLVLASIPFAIIYTIQIMKE